MLWWQHRVESRHSQPGLIQLLQQSAPEFEALVSYAENWAAQGAYALWKFERQPQTGSLLLQLEGGGEAGRQRSGLRELLEAPLGRLAEYEVVATELSCSLFDRSTATGDITHLLFALDQLAVRISAALARVSRLRPLWGVASRFKAGEVDDLLGAEGRELRHDGPLLKKTTVGKVMRQCAARFGTLRWRRCPPLSAAVSRAATFSSATRS